MSRNPKISLGLIGLGSIGVLHAAILRGSGSAFLLRGTADPKPRKRYKDIVNVAQYQDLLGDENIEAVSIATPPNTHYKIAADALAAGKHVLLEKPPTLTLQELKKLAVKAGKKKRVLFTALHARYRPEVDSAVKELRDKPVKEIAIHYLENVLYWHPASSWIFDPEIAGGGALIDSGINAISIVFKVLPHMELKVAEAKLFQSSKHRVETKAEVHFEFEGGKGSLIMDWLHKGPETRQLTFSTSDDTYMIDIVQSLLLKNGVSVLGVKNRQRTRVDPGFEYRSMYQDFADHIHGRRSFISERELKFVLDAYRVAQQCGVPK